MADGRLSRGAPRSHIVILAVLSTGLVAGALGTFWTDRRRETRLQDELSQDMAVLSSLPNLRGEARRFDLLTQFSISERGAGWPVKRVSAEAELRARLAELAGRCASSALERPCAGLSATLEPFVAAEDARVKTPSVSAAQETARARREQFLDAISSIADAASDDLERRLRLARGESLRLILTRLAIQLTAALIGSGLLYLFVLRPIALLDEQSARWSLGVAWTEGKLPAIAELKNLTTRFADMARRLNEQYDREKRLNEFKTSLVSAVSHEFGNALSIISNAAFLLGERMSEEQREEARPLFEIVRSNVDVLGGEVLNILSSARVEAGRLDAVVEAVDVLGILRTSIQRMKPLALRKKLKLTLDASAHAPLLKADPAILNLAISNLLSNAIKYTHENGVVVAGIRSEPNRPGEWRVFTRDTGIGLSEADKARILRGHYRTEQGRRMTPRGFGIGLSLTRRIVEAHGSRLDIDSRLGVGSEFSFVLPEWRGGSQTSARRERA